MITLRDIQMRLADAIKQSGATQRSIADKLNIKQQTVQQYVSGRAMPSLETFANLCQILDISSDDILGLNK